MNEPTDWEVSIQSFKIFVGVVLGIFIITILVHLNHNLTTIIGQNAEIIELLQK